MNYGDTYPLIVVGSSAIALAMALNEWRHGHNIECHRISAVFGIILVLHTLYLLWDIDASLPPLRPLVETVSLILILWAFVRPTYEEAKAIRLRDSLLILAILGGIATYLLWVDSRQQTPWMTYADHWSMVIWHLAQVGLAGLGTWLILTRRGDGRLLLVLAFGVLAAANAIAILGYTSIMGPANAFYYPLLAIATYQTITNDLRSFGDELRSVSQRALSRTKGQIFLLEVSKAASATLELSATLQIIADYSGLAFDADSVVLLLNDDDDQGERLEVAASYSPLATNDSDSDQTHLYLADFPLLEFVVRRQSQLKLDRPEAQPDAYRDLRAFEQLLGLANLGPFIIQPLIFRDQTIGLALGARSRDRQVFSEEEGRLFGAMASLVAATLENPQLSQEVGEANLALTQLNQDLNSPYQHLHDLDQLESSFIGLVTHELRSLFVDLDLSLQLMRRHGVDNLEEPQRELLEQFEVGVGRAREMVDSVVAFASLLSKQGVLQLESFDFSAVVGQVASLLEPMAQNREITLSPQSDVSPLTIEADHKRLTEAVQHLIHNAIKFSRAGGEVTIRYWTDDAHLVFEVEDTGVGIQENDLETIWYQFAQTADPVRRGVEGLGVGLAAVKLIVEAHDGEVAAQSKVDVGSSFGFRLPLQQPEPVEANAPVADPEGQEPATSEVETD